MYDYRRWSNAKREEAIANRRALGLPTHAPAHPEACNRYRLITAACFEHINHLADSARRDWFQSSLLQELEHNDFACAAWVVLANHYHLLVKIDSIERFKFWNRQFHGRTARRINLEDAAAGRKVWYQFTDRVMRSERHYFTTLNYIHHNPVKHHLVRKWGDWKHSSFHSYLECYGRDWLLDIWRRFPLKQYGEGWDD